MSTTSPEGRRRPPGRPPVRALSALLGTLALVVTGCQGDTGPAGPSSAPGSGDPQGGIAAALDAPYVMKGLQRNLDRRASSITTGDVARFVAGLATRDPAFLAQQSQYFANLRQLPVQLLSFALVPASLMRTGSSYAVNVEVTLQLQGYDAVPVTSVDRYYFVGLPQGRAFRLASVTDADWEARNDVQEQPWDAGPIRVRTRTGVLGIFDPRSVQDAAPLLASVRSGIDAVSAVVPYTWSRTVVVYALSDDRFLGSIPDLPGGDPADVDAVSFPVLADADAGGADAEGADAEGADAEVASTRLVMSSRMLSRTGPGRDRLVRHELTHAAIGAHDDHAPVWLGEGLAEYVSVQAEPVADRVVPDEALAAARTGLSELPDDRTFNDADATAHYGLAWWACEYVAATSGQAALWTLLDQLDTGARLESVLGISPRMLARRASRLLLATFEPPAPVVPDPVPVPVAPVPVAPAPVVPTASAGIS